MRALTHFATNVAYLTLMLLAVPYLIWRFVVGKSRRGWMQKLFGLRISATDGQVVGEQTIWFHAVSVGEVNLLETIFRQLPGEYQVAISTSTETGYDLAQQKYPNHLVFFCPIDFSWAVRRTLTTLKPVAVVLAELEVWPNLISILNEKQIPVIVANGRLSEKSFGGYQRFSFLTRRSFEQLSLVAAQNPTYAQRFVQLGTPAKYVEVTGSIKFDGAKTDRCNPQTQNLTADSGISDQDFVFVAGSTQLEEDLILADVYRELKPIFPQLRFVVVPRHPERSGVLATELASRDVKFSMRSEQGKLPQGAADFLVVDLIGELGGWWGRADAGYVGGSMGYREGQNMIEPAAFGVPICFGPRTANFRDVVAQLLGRDAAIVVYNAGDITRFLRQAIDESIGMTDASIGEMLAMGQRAREVVQQNLGATEKTVRLIVSTIGQRDTR